MHVSWHLNYLRPHPTHTQTHTYNPSVSTSSITSTRTLPLRREHINSTHNAGWCTWLIAAAVCPKHTLQDVPLSNCHAPVVIMSRRLSAHWNGQRRRRTLFPAGGSGCSESTFNKSVHHSNLNGDVWAAGLHVLTRFVILIVSQLTLLNLCQKVQEPPVTTYSYRKDYRTDRYIHSLWNPCAPCPAYLMLNW